MYAAGGGAIFVLTGVFDSSADVGERVVVGIVAGVLEAFGMRAALVGLSLAPWTITVRDVLATYKLPRGDVLGLAVERVARGRFQRLVVVCADGRIIPANWTIARASNANWVARASYLAQGFGPTQAEVSATLAEHDRLAADGPIPLATRDPGLTPQTVGPAEDGPQSSLARLGDRFRCRSVRAARCRRRGHDARPASRGSGRSRRVRPSPATITSRPACSC